MLLFVGIASLSLLMVNLTVKAEAPPISPSISSDGNLVVFQSQSDSLVTNDTNGAIDIFVKNRATGTVTRVSTDAGGSQANDMSVKGRLLADNTNVLFYSDASNLVPNDTNSAGDIFIKNLQTGSISRVSTDATGDQLVSGIPDANMNVTADGRWLVFATSANGLVAGDSDNQTDVFRKDLQSGTIVRVSTDADGLGGDGGTAYDREGATLTADGRYVGFLSNATNLVSGDNNGQLDLFVKDLQTNTITRANTASNGDQTAGSIYSPTLAADGRYIFF